MTIRDLCEPEICGLQAILPDIIKNAAPLPANVLKKLLTIINDEQESRRERAKFGDWVKSSAEQIKKEQPTDEIKVGDRVVAHVGPNMDWYGTVKKIIPDTDGLYGENLLRIRVGGGCLLEHRVSRCTKIDSEKENDIDIHKDTDDPVKSIADVVEEYRKEFAKIASELVDFDWQQYRAELASKIAVAYAEKGRYAPDEIGGFAVMVANDVVDNLKKQEQC